MTARIVLLGLSVFLACLIVRTADGAIWYVDCSVVDQKLSDGKTPERAFKTIQKGIDVAGDGDTIIVAEGIYGENIEIIDKNIVLRSTNLHNSNIVAKTICKVPIS